MCGCVDCLPEIVTPEGLHVVVMNGPAWLATLENEVCLGRSATLVGPVLRSSSPGKFGGIGSPHTKVLAGLLWTYLEQLNLVAWCLLTWSPCLLASHSHAPSLPATMAVLHTLHLRGKVCFGCGFCSSLPRRA